MSTIAATGAVERELDDRLARVEDGQARVPDGRDDDQGEGERPGAAIAQTQPRRSATRPVQKPARMPATHAAKALRVTTKTRIQMRAGAQASGSSVARASMTTPASPMIE